MTSGNGESMAWDFLDRQYRNTGPGADWVYVFAGSGERIAKFPAKAAVLRREMARYVAEANILAKGWSLPACAGAFADVPCTDPDARYIQLVYDKGSHRRLQRFAAPVLSRRVPHARPDGGPRRQGLQARRLRSAGLRRNFSGRLLHRAVRRRSPRGSSSSIATASPPGCGASPLLYCPGNTVGEWEMLVWLAKAPGASQGTLLWSAYHPVPRGTIYTFRDDSNRIVTEMAGGSSGASTATLSVTRDNVFLGNLLVASYVASPAGWQYTTSDHLGSPRVVFNQSGQIVETHKYWPYGEDTTAAPPTQRLAYCLMERDTESTRFYDHARTHDHDLGRFLSPGPRRRDAGESAVVEPVRVHAQQPDEARGSGRKTNDHHPRYVQQRDQGLPAGRPVLPARREHRARQSLRIASMVGKEQS